MSPVLNSWASMDIQVREINLSSPFEEQEADSFRPVGIAIGIAIVALLVTVTCVLVIGIVVRRRRQQQQMSRIPSARRTSRQRLFPLSMPTLLSRPTMMPIDGSQEYSPATRNYRPQRSSPKTSTLAREPSLSDATTLTSSTAKDSKFGSDIHLEVLHMPLPPPPSYQEIPVDGPIRSMSGSSWVTEGPVEGVESVPMGRSYGGVRKLGMRKAPARGGIATRRM